MGNKKLLSDAGLLIFRLGISYLMIAYHGWGKIVKLFSGEEIQFADPIGIGMVTSFVLAAFAEFVCSILISLGLLTRWASLVLAFNMFVAGFIFHAADPFSSRQLPILFFLGYVVLAMVGGGDFSLDKLLKKR